MGEMTSKEQILEAVRQVPLLSPNASRLLQLAAQADHELGDFIDIVKCDAALTARVLRVVNSAVYGLLNPITTIERGVSYLGERMIVCIALGDSAGKMFQKPMAGYEASAGDLWKHDLLSAIAAREVARHSRQDIGIDLAFTGGLLHDIGKGVMTDFLTGSAVDLVGDIARGELVDYVDGERKLLGLDHAEIGLELAKCWDLPAPLRYVIGFHHRPAEVPEEFRALVYSVHLGDIVAMMCGCATGSDAMQYQLDQGYPDYIALESKDLPLIMLQSQEEYAKAEASLNGSHKEQA